MYVLSWTSSYAVCIRVYCTVRLSFATTVSQLKMCDYSGETFKGFEVLYNFLWVQRRHNCSPVASFANCVMTLYLLKVHPQTFLSLPITQKCQDFELWHSCRKWALSCLSNCLFTICFMYFALYCVPINCFIFSIVHFMFVFLCFIFCFLFLCVLCSCMVCVIFLPMCIVVHILFV